jgi:hypothetical protein
VPPKGNTAQSLESLAVQFGTSRQANTLIGSIFEATIAAPAIKFFHCNFEKSDFREIKEWKFA